MSGFLLDTNIPSEVSHSRPDPRVAAWVHNQDDAALFLSVVSLGELLRGLPCFPQQASAAPAWSGGLKLTFCHGSKAAFCR